MASPFPLFTGPFSFPISRPLILMRYHHFNYICIVQYFQFVLKVVKYGYGRKR